MADADGSIILVPYSHELQMSFVSVEGGRAEMTMPYSANLVGDPATGVIDGGIVSALMDTCAGAAVMSHPDVPGITATLTLNIEYLRSACPGDHLHAVADCHHVTCNVAFVNVVATDRSNSLPVARASGKFTVNR